MDVHRSTDVAKLPELTAGALGGERPLVGSYHPQNVTLKMAAEKLHIRVLNKAGATYRSVRTLIRHLSPFSGTNPANKRRLNKLTSHVCVSARAARCFLPARTASPAR